MRGNAIKICFYKLIENLPSLATKKKNKKTWESSFNRIHFAL